MQSPSDVRLPAMRVSDLVMTETSDSLIVFDQKSNGIHNLDKLSSSVWRLLDGNRNEADILAEITEIDGKPVTLDSVRLAVADLASLDLLEVDPTPTANSQNRRQMLKKAGIAAVAVPAIMSVTAPQAAAQLSCNLPSCAVLQIGDPCCLDTSTIGICALGFICVEIGIGG